MKNVRIALVTITLSLALVLPGCGSGSKEVSDAFSNAVEITSTPFSQSMNTTGATSDPSDPTPIFPCGDGITPNSVWFSYTATNDNSIVAKTLGSDYDTVLSVWTGSPGSFSRVACNDDDFSGAVPSFQSSIAFAGSTGTTYHIMVSSFDGIGGSLSFNLSLQTPPANDNFADSTTASPLPFTETISAMGSSIEPSDPFSLCDSPIDTPTQWYSYTPAVNETITVNTTGSSYDTVLSVWTGTPGSFVNVDCNDDINFPSEVQSEVTFSATGGTTYHFMVASFFGDTGSLTFNVTVP